MSDKNFDFSKWEAMKAIDKGGRIAEVMAEIEKECLALANQWSRLSREEVCLFAGKEEFEPIQRMARELPEGLRPPEDACEFAVWAVIQLPFALVGRRFEEK